MQIASQALAFGGDDCPNPGIAQVQIVIDQDIIVFGPVADLAHRVRHAPENSRGRWAAGATQGRRCARATASETSPSVSSSSLVASSASTRPSSITMRLPMRSDSNEQASSCM